MHSQPTISRLILLPFPSARRPACHAKGEAVAAGRDVVAAAPGDDIYYFFYSAAAANGIWSFLRRRCHRRKEAWVDH
jgi:hypothetical protein